MSWIGVKSLGVGCVTSGVSARYTQWQPVCDNDVQAGCVRADELVRLVEAIRPHCLVEEYR